MTPTERMDTVATAWDRNRDDLLRFVRRMLVSPEVAEDVVQQTAQRSLEATRTPSEPLELRRWLFRIATNLAIDELRRQGLWSKTVLTDSRTDAEGDQPFVSASEAMRGTPETIAIARQHLAFCYSCTLRSLPPQEATTLLLVEVYGFTLNETAEILTASFGQIKNWLQNARANLNERYERLCALVNKQGVCYQCSELAAFFNGVPENPLAGTGGTSHDRARIVLTTEGDDLSAWHRRLLSIIEKRNTAT